MNMTIQMLVEAWKVSEAHHSMKPPATETEIQAAETKIGTTLPPPLREVYQVFNGGWAFELKFFPLFPPPEHYALTNSNERYIAYEWHIPKEIRLFADMGGEEVFGIWLPCCGDPIYNHPIIEVGDIGEQGCMGVVGTNLISFLSGWSAFQLVMTEDSELWKVELGEDKDAPNRLQRIQTALNTRKVPQSLRSEHHHEDPDKNFAQLRKWADPQLPDPSGNSYTQRYTITDFKKLFGVT